ncbi:MAG: J domain-containing protein, partial [Symploca sp. SIO2B6]|nr:J domain-containing protein [Symploca sp. SIO2B6]
IPLQKAYKGGKERIRLGDGRSLTVTLPPAMVSGQKIRVKAHEPSGDELSLLIKVAPHDLFTLKMPDVHCQIPITPSEAVLGGSISIPTLDGLVKMVLSAGTHSGQKMRLTGKGYPFDGKRGDQIVELEVKIPTNISLREREVYEKLRRIESFRPRRNLMP